MPLYIALVECKRLQVGMVLMKQSIWPLVPNIQLDLSSYTWIYVLPSHRAPLKSMRLNASLGYKLSYIISSTDFITSF